MFSAGCVAVLAGAVVAQGLAAWLDPDAQREFLARIEKYQNEGPPPPENRISREEIHGVRSMPS